MAIAHEIYEREGLCLDRITDEDAGVRIEISRVGAEIVSLARRSADGSWTGFLYRDGDVTQPSEGWKNHATVMGYFLHRLKNERTVYYGKEMLGGTHSFIRHKIFDAPALVEDQGVLRYHLRPEQIAPHEYPLKVAMELDFTLTGGGLNVVFRFRNAEPDRTAHVSFGLHPGFAVTDLEGCHVLLPAGQYRRHLAPGNFLSGEVVEIDHAGGEMPFAKSDLPGSFLLEPVRLKNRVIELEDPPSGRRVSLDLGDAPYLTLWSNGGPFVCLEPCWGLPDHHEQRPFEKKLGIQEIPAGDQLEAGFSIGISC